MAREWKYEVVWEGLGVPPIGDLVRYSLHYSNKELWFYVAGNTGPSERYIIHGLTGNWKSDVVPVSGILEMSLDVGSDNKPRLLFTHGSLYSRTLTFIQMNSGNWPSTDIAHAMGFDCQSLCLDGGNNPFITYAPLPPETNLIPIISWHMKSSEPYMVVMDSIDPGQRGISSAATVIGAPTCVYLNYIRTGKQYYEFRNATWDWNSESWTVTIIETDNDESIWKTGLFPILKYADNGSLGLAYSQIGQEVSPGVQYDKLMFRQLDDSAWSQELITERIHPSSATCAF